jgi:pre-mRNA-splicing factor CDC5/CEF1
MLKHAVRAHGANNLVAAAALVLGRTSRQCTQRWRTFLDPSIDRSTAIRGEWKADEDMKLKEAVRCHGAKNWKKIATLVPGRSLTKCCYRWGSVIDSEIIGIRAVPNTVKENEYGTLNNTATLRQDPDATANHADSDPVMKLNVYDAFWPTSFTSSSFRFPGAPV